MLDGLKDAIEYVYKAGVLANEKRKEKAFFKIDDDNVLVYVDQAGNPITRLNQEIASIIERPDDRQRIDKAGDIASFCALVKRHGTGGDDGKTEIFASESKVVAVLDMSGWRSHRIEMPLEYSPEWLFWSSKRTIAAATAAEEIAPFVDVVNGDRSTVSGDQLLEALADLEWTSEESTKVRMSASGMTISGAKGENVANLPNRLEVLAPVFRFAPEDGYRLSVRVSAKIANGTRSLVFSASGALALQRKALADVHNALASGLDGFPVHMGEPHRFNR